MEHIRGHYWTSHCAFVLCLVPNEIWIMPVCGSLCGFLNLDCGYSFWHLLFGIINIHCTFSTLVVGVLLWDVVYQTHLHYQLHQARITANTNGTVTMHIDNKHHIEILIMLCLFMTTEALQSLQQPLEIIHAPTTRTRRAFFTYGITSKPLWSHLWSWTLSSFNISFRLHSRGTLTMMRVKSWSIGKSFLCNLPSPTTLRT